METERIIWINKDDLKKRMRKTDEFRDGAACFFSYLIVRDILYIPVFEIFAIIWGALVILKCSTRIFRYKMNMPINYSNSKFISKTYHKSWNELQILDNRSPWICEKL